MRIIVSTFSGMRVSRLSSSLELSVTRTVARVRPRTGCRCTDDCQYYDCPGLRYPVGDDRPLDDFPLGGCHRDVVGVLDDFSSWS